MTQAITRKQSILEQMQTLTPQQEQQVLDFIEFLKYQSNKTEIKKTEPEQVEPISFYEAAKEFIGCVEGGPGDLATNKDYLRGIGR
jgi:hypothetical protein